LIYSLDGSTNIILLCNYYCADGLDNKTTNIINYHEELMGSEKKSADLNDPLVVYNQQHA